MARRIRPIVFGAFDEAIKGVTGGISITLRIQSPRKNDKPFPPIDGEAATEDVAVQNAIDKFHELYPGINVDFHNGSELMQWFN